MKTEFVCVKPRSTEAQDYFVHDMDSLHSCSVAEREDDRLHLKSISGRYFFWMREGGDEHWEVIK